MPEYWTGGSENDYFNYMGSDRLHARGGGGHDFIWGNNGNDSLFGEDGNDTLKGWYGNDFLSGGSGDDSLEGEADNDTLLGGDGYDTLVGGSGNDSLNGVRSGQISNATFDLLIGGTGADTFCIGDSSGAYYVGIGRYADINDFASTEGDKIQVYGSASDYSLQIISNTIDILYQGDRIATVWNTTDVSIPRDFIFV
jgi:Ca2+-binding RTX toxin-like protein